MAVKSAIKEMAHKKAQARWESTNDCRRARMMINTSSRIRTSCLIRLPRPACCRSDVWTSLPEPTSKYNEGRR